MKKWTKEEALKTLKKLAEEAEWLQNSKAFSTEHIKWITKCLETFEEVFGPASRYYLTFTALGWSERGQIITSLWDYKADIAAKNYEAFRRDLGIARGLLLGAIDYLKERALTEIYNAKDTRPEASLILKVLHLAEHQLRKVIREKPDKERQVQDAFENLLIGAEIPYGREIDKIEYSSKTYIPDFSLQKIGVAVDVKLCGREGREKEIIGEINDDILAYKSKYPNLLFVIYDLGYIRDVERFCNSFEEYENVTTRVIKH
jgi:hypothetical protein